MNSLNESIVTQAICNEYFEKFKNHQDMDVAIIGAGPSGLTAAWKLARQDFKVGVFERNLAIGGGMWGGGMTWNIIVVQEESKYVLEEAGVNLKRYQEGYYTADSIGATSALALQASNSGAGIFNCMSVEDVAIRQENGEKRINGIVINSTPVERTGLHVDPLVLNCRYLIDCTGHSTEVVNTLVRKNDVEINTPTGKIEGEKSMWADIAEKTTVENTLEIFPGIYVAGMAANACFGSYRMGPIFGGMLLSGEKVASDISQRLQGKR